MLLETSKIRSRALPFCAGCGLDIGCKDDKIRPEAMGFDDDPGPEVNWCGDAARLPFPDRCFDYVYSSHCLEDFADTAGVLAEWVRVLRPGGRLVLYVPHPDLYHGVNLDHQVPGFRPAEITVLLAQAGLRVLVATADTPEPDGVERYSTFAVAERA